MTSILAVAALCGASVLTSCSQQSTPFLGKWIAGNPENVTGLLPDSKSATATTELTFEKSPESADGVLTLTSKYDIDATGGNNGVDRFSATADVKGTWAYDVDDDDDLLLSFDMNTLKVASQDSTYTEAVERAFRSQLARYSVVSDIEVSKDGRTMTLEIHSPEMKMHFRSAAP